jgi:hypothetical protein
MLELMLSAAIKSLFTFAALEEGFFTADLAARRRIQGDNFICHRLEFVVYNLNELKKLQRDQNQIKAVILLMRERLSFLSLKKCL